MTKALFIREDYMMFILLGSIAALIISAIQIFAFCENRSFGKCLHFTIRNIFFQVYSYLFIIIILIMFNIYFRFCLVIKHK